VEVWQTSNLRRLRLGEEKKERRRKKNKPQHENRATINRAALNLFDLRVIETKYRKRLFELLPTRQKYTVRHITFMGFQMQSKLVKLMYSRHNQK